LKIVNNFSKRVKVSVEGIKLAGEEPVVRDKYDKDIERVLISKGCIRERVKMMAAEIANAFAEKKEVNCLVVLKGGIFFASDLIRIIDDETGLKTKIEFIRAQSYYDGHTPTGTVKLDESGIIQGDHILLIEDIVDTGTTLARIQTQLEKKGKFFKTCFLLDKGLPKAPGLKIDFVGFNIPNEFVAGYGLDYAGMYRGMPDVVVVNKELLK